LDENDEAKEYGMIDEVEKRIKIWSKIKSPQVEHYIDFKTFDFKL
jgi:hypothetical protein